MKALHKYSDIKDFSSDIIVSSVAWTETTFREIPDLIE